MNNAQIRLTCRQVMDATSNGAFQKQVLASTYAEFKLKSQAYNMEGRFHTFQEMVGNDGRANSLHYKLNFAALPYVEQLQKKMPHVFDMLEKPLPFDTVELQLIASDLRDVNAHKIALLYHSPVFLLVGTVGEYLLLANPEMPEHTFLLKVRAGISISHYTALAPVVSSYQSLVS